MQDVGFYQVMTTIGIIAIWLFATLIIATAACFAGKKYGVEFLATMFVGSIIIAGAVVNKFVQIGPFETSAGIVVFSMTFLLSDTIAEFWGKKKAQRIVMSGFLVYVMFVAVTQITIYLPATAWWDGQAAFELLFGQSWRIAGASLLAYILGQSHDVWSYHFWKKKTKGKLLWLRNNASTWTSQTIDSVVFLGVAFIGTMPLGMLWTLIWSTILLKVAVAAFDTPFLYLVRWFYTKVGKPWKPTNEQGVAVGV